MEKPFEFVSLLMNVFASNASQNVKKKPRIAIFSLTLLSLLMVSLFFSNQWKMTRILRKYRKSTFSFIPLIDNSPSFFCNWRRRILLSLSLSQKKITMIKILELIQNLTGKSNAQQKNHKSGATIIPESLWDHSFYLFCNQHIRSHSS